MENWQLALVVLAAIFVGVAIPMIIQYQATLRSIDRLVRNSEADVRRTLSEVAQLAAHLNHIGAAVDGNTKHLRTAFETFEEVADGVRRLRGSVKTASIVGAAVAPALSAVIRALQGGPAVTPDEEAETALERFEAAELEAARAHTREPRGGGSANGAGRVNGANGASGASGVRGESGVNGV